jgi:hypothetical protein
MPFILVMTYERHIRAATCDIYVICYVWPLCEIQYDLHMAHMQAVCQSDAIAICKSHSKCHVTPIYVCLLGWKSNMESASLYEVWDVDPS